MGHADQHRHRDPEARAWRIIRAARQRIRGRVFRTGMAGQLHTRKGASILEDPELISRYVEPLDSEDRIERYLQTLPGLIERTAAQDEACGELWSTIGSPTDREDFDRASAALSNLFLKFRFKLRSYELLVRQPRKPILENAIRLLAGGAGGEDEIYELESHLRLPLREYVTLEEETAIDLRLLDDTFAGIIAAHEAWARVRAKLIAGADPGAFQYALCGLSRAVESYDDRRGYPFREYAEPWIETSIREKKTWGQ